MNRLGLLTPSDLDPAQNVLYEALAKSTERLRERFIVRDTKDRFIGPFGIVLHDPTIGDAFLRFAGALAGIKGLPVKAREVAILVVGHRNKAAYEVYAHERSSKFSKEDLEAISQGRCPEGFGAEQKIAFKIATEFRRAGPLSKETWDESVKVLGVSGTTALIHYVGFYSYVSVILNGFDAGVPVPSKL